MTDYRASVPRLHALASTLAITLTLPLSAAAASTVAEQLTPEVSVSVALEADWDTEAWAAEFWMTTDEAGGRSVMIEAENASRRLENRQLFARGARIEYLRGEVLGQQATLLRGQTNDTFSTTVSRRSTLRGTRLAAILDLCHPDGEPVVITLVSADSFNLPGDDPVLARMLGALTLELGPGMAPCPERLHERFAGGLGAAPAEMAAGEEGFKRLGAMGLSIAVPEQMTGSFEETGGMLLNGPDRLQVTLAIGDPAHLAPLRRRAEMTEAGSIDLGALGRFDVLTRSITGQYSWNPDYATHETWVVSIATFPYVRSGTESEGVINLRIANEGDTIPGWDELEPIHRRIVELLRPEEG